MVRRIDKAEDHRNDGKHYAGLLSRGEYNKRKAHVEDTVDMQVWAHAAPPGGRQPKGVGLSGGGGSGGSWRQRQGDMARRFLTLNAMCSHPRDPSPPPSSPPNTTYRRTCRRRRRQW
jgi:hypothetical protein